MSHLCDENGSYEPGEAVMEGQQVLEDYKTEGKKSDQEKPDMSLVEAEAVIEEARVMTFGKRKYGANNWRSGLAWTRVIAAILRHTFAILRGEDYDPETGLLHAAHVRCGAAFLIWYKVHRPEFDDRYKDAAKS